MSYLKYFLRHLPCVFIEPNKLIDGGDQGVGEAGPEKVGELNQAMQKQCVKIQYGYIGALQSNMMHEYQFNQKETPSPFVLYSDNNKRYFPLRVDNQTHFFEVDKIIESDKLCWTELYQVFDSYLKSKYCFLYMANKFLKIIKDGRDVNMGELKTVLKMLGKSYAIKISTGFKIGKTLKECSDTARSYIQENKLQPDVIIDAPTNAFALMFAIAIDLSGFEKAECKEAETKSDRLIELLIQKIEEYKYPYNVENPKFHKIFEEIKQKDLTIQDDKLILGQAQQITHVLRSIIIIKEAKTFDFS